MKNIKASSRYAKALLTQAIALNKIEEVFANITQLKQVVSTNKDFSSMLKSPVVKNDKKNEIVTAIFAQHFDELTLNYLQLVITNNRAELIPEIATQFVNQYNTHHNIIEVEITSAIALSDTEKQKILNLVPHKGKINLTQKVNPNLIGGFVLKMGDKQIDASIAKKFSDLKKEITLN